MSLSFIKNSVTQFKLDPTYIMNRCNDSVIESRHYTEESERRNLHVTRDIAKYMIQLYIARQQLCDSQTSQSICSRKIILKGSLFQSEMLHMIPD